MYVFWAFSLIAIYMICSIYPPRYIPSLGKFVCQCWGYECNFVGSGSIASSIKVGRLIFNRKKQHILFFLIINKNSRLTEHLFSWLYIFCILSYKKKSGSATRDHKNVDILQTEVSCSNLVFLPIFCIIIRKRIFL